MGELGRRNAPRWEWRTFGAGLSDIEAKVGLTARIAPRQSDEIYLLNFATPHSAKIRGGVLEVKRLLQVDSSGLEQWSPAFKARFPLSAPMLQIRVRRARSSTTYDMARSLRFGRVFGGGGLK